MKRNVTLLTRELWAGLLSHWETRHLRRKISACEGTDTRYYGGTATIQASNKLDVELDQHGNVVAVWFRCQALPFNQVRVDAARAMDMHIMRRNGLAELHGVEVRDELR